MIMEIRNLIAFLTVAETKNFTRAAEKLGYSQSAVTVQIKHLESELGVKLFDRIGKTVTLTSYGASFIECAGQAVEAMDRAASFNAGISGSSGTIKFGVVGAILTSVLTDVLLEYRKRFPYVTVSIVEGSSSDLEKKIRKSELDLAYFLDFKTPSNEWVRVREEREPIIVVTNPENPLAKRGSVEFSELAKEDLILMPKGENYRTLFDNELVKYGITVEPAVEVVNTDTIIKLLAAGPYVSLMPEFAVRKSIKDGLICPVNVEGLDLCQYSQLAYLKGKVITPHIRGFIDTILEKC